jgi:protein O-GlcNAc transferase
MDQANRRVDIDAQLQAALQWQQRGELAEADRLYRQILAVVPDQPLALHRLGLLAIQAGHEVAALEWLWKSIQAAPQEADFYSNLGLVLSRLGRFEEACAVMEQAVRLAPRSPQLYSNWGHILHAGGRSRDAVPVLQRAIDLQPNHAEAMNNLAVVYQNLQAWPSSIDVLRRLLSSHPADARAYYHLGLAYDALGEKSAAKNALQQSLVIAPTQAEAHNQLGKIYFEEGRWSEAIEALAQALHYRPQYLQATMNLAMVCQAGADHQQAIVWYERARQLAPESVEVAIAFAHQLQWVCTWERLAELNRQILDAVEQLENSPDQRWLPPFWFICLTEPTSSRQQWRVARNWAQRIAGGSHRQGTAAKPTAVTGGDDGDEGRPLRIGYLSADFGQHATSWLIGDLFAEHDRRQVAVWAYSFGPEDRSPLRQRIEQSVDGFRELGDCSHRQAAEMIQGDKIDILVDLKGYTDHARPEILALRPARIQVNYLGFPGTMGADFIDYILVDDVVVPPDRQACYQEKLVTLPGCYQVNCRQLEIAPQVPKRVEVGLSEEAIVLCAFHQPFKLTPWVFDIWMRLLRDVPASVLWLLEDNTMVKRNLQQAAVQRGVPVERLVFAARVPHPLHLARLRLADLFVDTFPCNAHTTASEALRMGVPVVTWSGEAFASRVAGSLLREVGLPECISQTATGYEHILRRLVMDDDWRRTLHQRLATNLQRTSLYDPRAFARKLEQAYRRMWVESGRLTEPSPGRGME